MKFVTHDGQTITGDRLLSALKEMAGGYRLYAEKRDKRLKAKDTCLMTRDRLYFSWMQAADDLEAGKTLGNFSVWQKLNTKFTGKCVGMFEK